MSRYASDLRTSISRDEAWRVVCEYLGSQGFQMLDEKAENVWRKGAGLAAVPQFMKVTPADGSVHMEAWLASVSWVPGVYTGEMDLTGAWGFAMKSALKSRVRALEMKLGDDVTWRGRIQSPAPVDPRMLARPAMAMAPVSQAPAPAMAAVAPLAAPPATNQPPASWCADPTGRHQLRYWDGTAWTGNVCDNGQTSLDAV